MSALWSWLGGCQREANGLTHQRAAQNFSRPRSVGIEAVSSDVTHHLQSGYGLTAMSTK